MVDHGSKFDQLVGELDYPPVLDDAAAWFVGRIERRVDFGDHVGHLLEPVDVHFEPPLGPILTFADVRSMEPGHDA